jgi:catechol 2,3-dioxygenase-like lactoylglutathione lyase family enzyme
MPKPPNSVTPIVPCNDLDASQRFYEQLGFREGDPDASFRAEYRILEDGDGGAIHLQPAVPGWVVPGRNPFGVYIASRRLLDIAARFGRTPRATEYGMLEITLSDPDETLVRVGWRKEPASDPPASRRASSRPPGSSPGARRQRPTRRHGRR